MTPDPKRALAWHEAGHFVSLVLLTGETPALLSIRKAPGYAGVCIGFGGQLDFTGHHRDRPLGSADPQLRADCERAIIGLLAGHVAERLVSRISGYIDETPTPDEREAEALAASIGRLSPRDLELLAEAEGMPPPDDSQPFQSDDLEAQEIAFRLAGMTAGLYVNWLRAVAGELVQRHVAAVAAVAAALLANTILTGAEAAEIMERSATTPTPVTSSTVDSTTL